MRALIDLVENLTSSVRYVVGVLALVLIALGLMLTVGGSYVAPKAVEVIADRAERVTTQAIEVERDERRAEQLAEDGWGYAVPASGAAESADPGSDSDSGAGWAD